MEPGVTVLRTLASQFSGFKKFQDFLRVNIRCLQLTTVLFNDLLGLPGRTYWMFRQKARNVFLFTRNVTLGS